LANNGIHNPQTGRGIPNEIVVSAGRNEMINLYTPKRIGNFRANGTRLQGLYIYVKKDLTGESQRLRPTTGAAAYL
jgi:hypothetical protein